MELIILKDEKNLIEVEFDNQTIAELLRIYLNQDSNVSVAAWKREHYSKPVILRLETKGKPAKKVLGEVISKIQKDLKKYSEDFKKAK